MKQGTYKREIKYVSHCKYCDGRFSSTRNDKEFCSAKCRTAQYRLDYPQHFKGWYQKNRERNILKAIKWNQENPERVKDIRKKCNKKRRNDPQRHLGGIIASAISETLHGTRRGRKWQGLVGYSLYDLMKHLEKLFTPEMCWTNYGNYWELDHIRPQSLFDYKNSEDIEFRKCWALENLQPLEKGENRRKYNHFNEQRSLF